LALACAYIAETLVEELDEPDEPLDELPPLELLDPPPPELAANPAPWGSATPTASANANVMNTRLVACILFLLRQITGHGWVIWLNEQGIGSDYSSFLRCR
jgi:hypothetical protein